MAGPGRPRKLPMQGDGMPSETSQNLGVAGHVETSVSSESSVSSEETLPSVPAETVGVTRAPSDRKVPPGYKPIDSAPVDGTRIVLSPDGKRDVLAFRRKTRVVDKKNLRYLPSFRWTEVFSRTDIDFEPLFWRSHDPDEVFPKAMA